MASLSTEHSEDPSAQQVRPLLALFVDETMGLDDRIDAAAELAELMDWVSPQHAKCQLALHQQDIVTTALEVLRGTTLGAPQPEALRETAWHLIGAVVLHEAVAACAVRHLPEMLKLVIPIIENQHASALLVEACLAALNNLCFRAPSARPLLVPCAPLVLRWARRHENPGLEGAACLLLGNVSKHAPARAELLSIGVARDVSPVALDAAAPLHRRGPAISAVARLDSGVRERLLATGALETYFAPTMRAAVERREGPAGNLPGLDTAEHFALLCDSASGVHRCVDQGVIRLMQDVLLCPEEHATRVEDLEGKRWALDALAHIARQPELRDKVRGSGREAKLLSEQFRAFQDSEHAGARAAAMRLSCCLHDGWLPSVQLVGMRLANTGVIAPCVWVECVLPFVVGPLEEMRVSPGSIVISI